MVGHPKHGAQLKFPMAWSPERGAPEWVLRDTSGTESPLRFTHLMVGSGHRVKGSFLNF